MHAEQAGPRSAQIAYALFRIALGLDMFLHGVMRLLPTPANPGVIYLSGWVDTTTKLFENSFLPTALVRGFLYFLPFPEAVIGALLMAGFLTRQALIAGSLVILILIFGTGTRQDWTVIGTQMLYALYYYLMLARLDDNWLAVDARRS
jgi:thiosulfate dehydrogenase (quinone) large subunit